MRIDIIPESLIERLGLRAGVVPEPIVHTMIPILLARVLMTAVRFDLFESLREGPLTAATLAARSDTDAASTERLLHALEGVGYVSRSGDLYALSPVARRWLTSESPIDLSDAVLHRYLDAALTDGADQFLRTGAPLDFHRDMSEKDRRVYIDGQRAQARLVTPEIVQKLPLSEGVRDFLDLGGGHGMVAAAVCDLHETIKAVVMDLPEALAQVDTSGLPNGLSFQAVDILCDNLPSEAFDMVYAGNLAHHLNADQNALMFEKLASSLRPGGTCAVVDFVIDRSQKASQFPALLDFYFALTSGGGTWSKEDFATWMGAAGLRNVKFAKLRSGPGLALITSRKA